MTSITDAALAFAKCYERCGSGSYTTRQNNAIIAYNYFVSENEISAGWPEPRRPPAGN